jgi:hypothetical protein
MDLTAVATWTSSAPATIAVSAGAATSVAAGTATVSATVGTITGSTSMATCQLLVNELQTFGGAAANEWVELRSTCASPQALGALTLVYRGSTATMDAPMLTLSGTIAPAGLVLYVNSAVTADPMYAGHGGTFSVAMASAGGAVGLRVTATAALLDSVGWGVATNPLVEGAAAAAPGGYQSIARLAADTDNNATDFTLRTAPTPGAPNH